jgi:hypothetical protein
MVRRTLFLVDKVKFQNFLLQVDEYSFFYPFNCQCLLINERYNSLGSEAEYTASSIFVAVIATVSGR